MDMSFIRCLGFSDVLGDMELDAGYIFELTNGWIPPKMMGLGKGGLRKNMAIFGT